MFEKRATQKELLDQNPNLALVEKSHKFMQFVNKYLGGKAPVQKFIETYMLRYGLAEISVLDIGSGFGDIPISIQKNLARKGLKTDFTCLELDPLAARQAQKNIKKSNANLNIIQADILDYHPLHRFDIAVGSMFYHHLTDSQVTSLINHLSSFCNAALINDLHRTALTFTGCRIASLFLPSAVSHDALLSVKKGFTEKDFERIIPRHFHTEIHTAFFGRIIAQIKFTK